VDWHLITDVASLFVAVAGTYLATRRGMADRISALESEVSEIRGVLRGAGTWDGLERRRQRR
jgi:hypothetical protein